MLKCKSGQGHESLAGTIAYSFYTFMFVEGKRVDLVVSLGMLLASPSLLPLSWSRSAAKYIHSMEDQKRSRESDLPSGWGKGTTYKGKITFTLDFLEPSLFSRPCSISYLSLSLTYQKNESTISCSLYFNEPKEHFSYFSYKFGEKVHLRRTKVALLLLLCLTYGFK